MALRIGIPMPTSADFGYNHVCWPQYAAAVARAGGEAVSLPLDGRFEALEAAAKAMDGFVLPGSPADVAPASYGQPALAATAAADPAREACDRMLLAHAAAAGKPVLAICFGMQMLNAWCGGTLVQDLAPVPVNHAAGGQVAVAHSVLVEQESLLAGLLSASEAPPCRPEPGSVTGSGEPPRLRLPVNSSHHQAVAEVARNMAVVARSAEDGMIEAVEGRIGEAAMVGVQWHPERSTEISAASRALFTWLVSEAEDRQGTVTLEGVGAGHQ